MKKTDYMWLIISNVCIWGCTLGYILYSLTFTTVPVYETYRWYGQDLHTYLCIMHARTFVTGLLIDVFANFLLIKNW